MAYTKQNFSAEQILMADQLNVMEDGIVMVEEKADAAQAYAEQSNSNLNDAVSSLSVQTSEDISAALSTAKSYSDSKLSSAVSTLNSTINTLSSDTSTGFANVRSELAGEVSTLTAQITNVETNAYNDLTALNQDLNTVSQTLSANIDALATQTTSDIATAKSEAISSAQSYTNSEISSLTTTMNAADASLASEIEVVATNLSDYKDEVATEFASLRQEITEANSASVEYVDAEIDKLVAANEDQNASIESNATQIDALETAVQALTPFVFYYNTTGGISGATVKEVVSALNTPLVLCRKYQTSTASYDQALLTSTYQELVSRTITTTTETEGSVEEGEDGEVIVGGGSTTVTTNFDVVRTEVSFVFANGTTLTGAYEEDESLEYLVDEWTYN